MGRHTEVGRERGYPFAADPPQQLARVDGAVISHLLGGAAYLLCNDYERHLLESKTGASGEEVLARVGVRLTTLGKDGVLVEEAGQAPVTVPVLPETGRADPTGVGDGFRAGFFAALDWGLSPERGAQGGSLLATLVLETVGTQEYQVKTVDVAERLAAAYGDDAATEILPHLPHRAGMYF